ncbi:kinetochore-associated Ndc80 complex subunit nuf2, variant 2 [Batrachochytrium dendrobatidis]
MEVFQECCTKSTQLTEERLMLERRNAELAETVNQIKMKRAQDQPQVDGIRAINTSLAADLRELKKTQVTLASKIDHLKKEKNACTEKQTNNQFLISNLKQNCVRLKSRVVHSPEKLKQVIAEMNRSLQEDKTYVVHTEKKNRELTHKIELMNAVEQDIIMCQNIMGECTTEQARAEEASQKLLSDIDVINKKKSELKDQEVHRQQLQRQLKNANEKLQRLEQHRVSKEQDTASRINALKEEHEILAAERDVAQKRVDDHERLVVDMEDKIKQLQKNMDSELFAIASDYELLIRETELYQQGLINAMF